MSRFHAVLRGATAVAALVLLSGCGSADRTEAPATVVQQSELQLPAGFEAQVVFEGTGEAREIYVRADGDLFVSLSGLRDGNHILGLRDTDGDFVIDVIEPFYPLTTPDEQRAPRVQIEYFDDYLYAADNERLVRLHLPPGQLSPRGDMEVVVDQIPHQSSHYARSLSVDPQGWLYVDIGAPSNACQANPKTKGSPGLDPCTQLKEHAGIWRWRSDVLNQSREDGEQFAGGIRNAIAQTWDTVYDGLFVAQMGRDRLDSLWPELFDSEQSAELPAEEFFRVEKGQNFGWPYCYYDHLQKKKVLAPEYGGDGRTVGRCADYAGPQVAFPGHYSPASIAFYHADHFPERYQGGAFVALKGSWNRAPLPQDGYIVAFVPFADGEPTGEWEVFADGFKGFNTLYERGNARYRPQGVAVHPDGSLYILDNKEGRIWRITYSGKAATTSRAAGSQPESDRNLIVAASQGRGAEIYLTYCASCHQAQGGGVPGEFPPLVNSEWVYGDKGRLIRTVLHGMRGPIEREGQRYNEIMPGHAFLDDEDVAALLTFVRSSFNNTAEPVHKSEVLLVRTSDPSESPWNAAELEGRLGLTQPSRNVGPDTR